jgi:hypothetical protein
MYDVPQKLGVPRLFDLYDNPQETVQETLGESAAVTRAWVMHAMLAELAKMKATLAKDPLIPLGTPDPYTPPKAGGPDSTIDLPTPRARD